MPHHTVRSAAVVTAGRRSLSCLGLCLLLGAAGCNGAKHRNAEWATPIENEHVGNLYKVSDQLYRGKQPTREGLEYLQTMGIKTVVNLRTHDTDSELLEGLDLSYERIPFSAGDPEEEDVLRFLRIVTDRTRQPVFVHCRRGADRTGMMVAVYRIVIQGWSNAQAQEEMEEGGYGFHTLLWRDLRNYVRNADAEALKEKLAAPAARD